MLPLLLMCLACSGDDTDDGPTPDGSGDPTAETAATADTGSTSMDLLVGAVTVEGSTNPQQHLVAFLVAETTEPTTASLVLDDGSAVRDVVFSEAQTTHRLPVLGLPAGTHQVGYRFEAADGAAVAGDVAVTLDEGGTLVPDVLLQGDPASAEPGYTLAGVWTARSGRLVAYDNEGRLVWLRELDGVPKAASLSDDGRVGVLIDRIATVRDMVGGAAVRYGPEPTDDVVVRDMFHHDQVFVDGGGFWSLETAPASVSEYPVALNDLTTFAPATVADDIIVHLGADGSIVGEWSMLELLDSRRVSFGSLDETQEGLDWGHANAVVPSTDAFVVSLRHQDALVRVDTVSNEVDWILANPDGWPPALEAKRLQPVGEVGWPYHAHGVKVVGDVVYVFDNGNERRTTPYSADPDPAGLYTRVVAYQVDPVARTVEELWAIVDDDQMFSKAMGNVQPLPSSGHVLATYPYQNSLDGVSNQDAGRGENITRLMEFDPKTGSVVWEIDLISSFDEAPDGWLSDRATRIPSLYAGLAAETWR